MKGFHVPTVLRFLRPALHLGLILGVFFVTYKLRLISDFLPGVQLRIPIIDFQETAIFAVCVALGFVVLGWIRGIYELGKTADNYRSNMMKVWVLRSISMTFLAYFGQGFVFVAGISRFIILWSAVFVLFGIWVIDTIWNRLIQLIETQKPYKLLFLYTDPEYYEEMLHYLVAYPIYHPVGIQVTLEDSSEKVGLQFLKEHVSSGKSYDMVVALGHFDNTFLQEVFDYLRLENKKFYHVVEGFFLEDLVYQPERIGGILAFEYKPSKLDGWAIVFKRIFDMVFSLMVIVVLSPVYVWIAWYIRSHDGGPIWYRSWRSGKGGKGFWMLKFRTMIQDADQLKAGLEAVNQRQGPLFKMEDDPRIPAWGRFLRKRSLDELPQFFNVLWGDMSVVGPRPHLPEEIKKYENRQRRLLSIKPGITGYAQIFGRDQLNFAEEARLDLYYIQNWKVGLDMYVILSTLGVLNKGR